MAIRLGIYLGKGLPNINAGGAYSLGETLFQEILIFPWQDISVVIFHYEPRNIASSNPAVTYASLMRWQIKTEDSFLKIFLKKLGNKISRFFKKNKSYLSAACVKHRIDLVWFPTPVFEAVTLPYFFTVWDLQHRKQPYFPEVSVSGSSFEDREKFYSNIVYKAARVIVGNSAGTKEVQAFYGIPLERIIEIEFPVPSYCRDFRKNTASKNTPSLPTNPYLFYPAQFWPHKNHVVILEAVKKLVTQSVMFDVIFTGADKGNLFYVQQYASDLGIDKQVHFKGFVPQSDLIAYYQNAFALVFASFFGPNNLPPLEAMALGCPVICAEYDGSREQLGDAAEFFVPHNEDTLVKILQRLHSNQEALKTLITRGFDLAEQHTANIYIQKIAAAIKKFSPIRRCWSSINQYKHT